MRGAYLLKNFLYKFYFFSKLIHFKIITIDTLKYFFSINLKTYFWSLIFIYDYFN